MHRNDNLDYQLHLEYAADLVAGGVDDVGVKSTLTQTARRKSATVFSPIEAVDLFA